MFLWIELGWQFLTYMGNPWSSDQGARSWWKQEKPSHISGDWQGWGSLCVWQAQCVFQFTSLFQGKIRWAVTTVWSQVLPVCSGASSFSEGALLMFYVYENSFNSLWASQLVILWKHIWHSPERCHMSHRSSTLSAQCSQQVGPQE